MFRDESTTTIENLSAVALSMLSLAETGTLPTIVASMSENDYDNFVWNIALTCNILGIDARTIRNNTALMQYIIRNETPKAPMLEPQYENVLVYMRVSNPETGEYIYTDYNLNLGANRRRMIKDILACAENDVFPKLSLEPFKE